MERENTLYGVHLGVCRRQSHCRAGGAQPLSGSYIMYGERENTFCGVHSEYVDNIHQSNTAAPRLLGGAGPLSGMGGWLRSVGLIKL